MLKLTTKEQQQWTWLILQYRGKGPDRADIATLDFPEVDGTKGVVLSCGQAPYWAVAPAISHYRNRSKWQGIYDPKLWGIVVVHTITPTFSVGSLIEAKLECLVCGRELHQAAIYSYCEEHRERSPQRQRRTT